ncbi:MAG: hypothetical protein K2X99_04220, partial [Gemmatimonadaceae bacterium]|nr:hypothetical protein [Gemmatimonadaceae bacterium]
VLDDAKSYFAAANRRYDFILSEPSNPWVSGVSGLFTDEFYARIRGYLTPRGVFGQWLHLYEIDDGLVLSVIKAVHRNFPSYRIYLTMDVDILIVASNQPELPEPDWSVFQLPAVAKDLSRFKPITPEALEGTLLADRALLAPIIGDASGANSDFFPALDLATERTRYLKTVATGFYTTTSDRYDLSAALTQRRIGWGTETVPALSMPRTQARALGARIRSREALSPIDTAQGDAPYRGALMRRQELENGLARDVPPSDWFLWFHALTDVERDVHAGTMGVVDSALYRRAELFMAKHGAPEAAQTSWRFLRAAASYDWRTASDEAAGVIAGRRTGRAWLASDLVRDAAVTARIHLGEISQARAAFGELTPYVTRKPYDLRTRLLEAWLEHAEMKQRRGS